jgi:hypothetical protein
MVLDRPGTSPWMWESWSLPGSKGAAFGASARGPFALYACFDSSITTSSGAMLICGRFPAMSCQVSFDSGMVWKLYTIDVSGSWAQGTLFEVEPDVVLYAYGGRGPGGSSYPWDAREQKMRVDFASRSLRWVPLDEQ